MTDTSQQGMQASGADQDQTASTYGQDSGFKPAEQPWLPNPDWNSTEKGKKNCDPPQDTPPDPCPQPHTDCEPTCDCPTPPPGSSNCLDDLIREQTDQSAAADKVKTLASDLEKLAVKVKATLADYTRDKYKPLLDRWIDQDQRIAKLIHTLVCAWPCWDCVIECRLCPLYYSVLDLEQWLSGSAPPDLKAGSLYDQQYLQTRYRDARKQKLDRVTAVLAAWEKPIQTIGDVLNANEARLTGAKTITPALLYDVFMTLVPLHLLIAPPKSVAKTLIDAKYTRLCRCDKGNPDQCCGPDTGTPRLLERVLGPQPYLVPPESLSTLLCCLIVKRYKPAVLAWADAEGALSATENQIKRAKADIDEKTKSIEKDAKAELAKAIDCCKEKKKDKPGGSGGSGGSGSNSGKGDDRDCGCGKSDQKTPHNDSSSDTATDRSAA